MRIEDEIQQKDFKDDHRRMVVNLLFSNNWLNQQFIPFFKQYGLTLQQHNVLSIVRGQQPKPVCFGEVQERMVDRNSNVTRLVDKLIEKGYVTRDICQANRRMIELRLTQEGSELLSKIDEQMPAFFQRFHTLTKEEANLLSQLLDKLRG